jgi:asparagine synthase (glutamine-hydrolysing)
MCGIAGIVAPKGFNPRTLVEMTQLIRYRGPDGYGFAFSGAQGSSLALEVIHNEERAPACPRPVIGLGNRRLAILDVSAAGSQPMQTEDGAYTITFNGEIYNYREIRAELLQAGHSFRNHTDTEVILHAYQQWGEECLSRFNGMWAFALWDRIRQRLFCARDRFGVKPFYYALHHGDFYFASEIKQILQAAAMPRIANPATAFHFLEWGLVDHSSDTFFEGIYQLPGGHCLTLEPGTTLAPQIRRYWDLQTAPQLDLSDDEAIREFRELLQNAVTLRLRSDVPVGVSLSGGLDSSAVVCTARRFAPQTELQTFSACFEDAEIDEREYVTAVVQQIQGVGHMAFPQGAGFWNTLKTLIYHQDEPVGSPGAYAQWCVMADARTHGVPVILGGQGGDETLCGYQKYQFFYWWHLLRRGDPQFFRESFQWLRQGTSSSAWSFAAAARYLPAPLRTPFSLTKRICTEDLLQLSRAMRSGLGSGRTIAERQKTDLTYSSIPALLHHEDRAAMAHSVESRLPFLDYRLVEFLLRCSPSLKLRDGWSKWLLRKALAETLPEKIRLRKTKLGFNTPETKWLRLGLQNGYRRLWDTPDLRMKRFIDPARFRRECEALVDNRPGALAAGPLFRAISLETWAHVHAVN